MSAALLMLMTLAIATSGAERKGPTPFDRMDNNNDNKLSQKEFKGPDKIFENMDTDGNDYITKREMREFHEKKGNSSSRDDDREQSSRTEHTGPYPPLTISIYDKEKAWPGNLIFVDKNWNRVVEADLNGNIVWECTAPQAETSPHMKGFCGAMLTDVELLPNDHVLILIGGVGVYELNRTGKVVWSYLNDTVSHDADRLANGNTIMACAGAEMRSEFPYDDPQAIEVNRDGEIVWQWHAKEHYLQSKYRNIRSRDANDWTHLNSVQRLDDGTTLLSIRNWNMIIGVNSKGEPVWETGGNIKKGPKEWPAGSPNCPHTPVMLDNGNIIISESMNGKVIEWDPEEEKTIWKYPNTEWRQGAGPYYFLRASHRLPNGNTFMIDSKGMFIEVTANREIAWKAKVDGCVQSAQPLKKEELNKVPCFNADRRGLPYYGGR